MAVDPRIQQVIQLIRDNKKAEARQLITILLNDKPQDADLLYFAAAASDGEKRIDYLRLALAVNPNHARSKAMLDKLAPISVSQPISRSMPTAPATSPRRNPLGWVIAALIVIALMAASAFGGYQVGHEAGLRSFGNTMVVALYGNEASQTAKPTSDAAFGATRNAIEASYGATSTAMYVEATMTSASRYAEQTAAAPKIVSSVDEVAAIPGEYRTANWSIKVSVSPLDDKTEALATLTDDSGDIYNASYIRIECKASEFSMHFSLNSGLSLGDEPISIRLDKEPVRVLEKTEYSGISYLSLASPRAFIKSITGHDHLVIAVGETTPVIFSISSVDVAAAYPLKACGLE